MALTVHSDALRMFLSVTETGSFTAAADATGFTQSAISKKIRNLERDLGTPLFVRNARGVALTPAGGLVAARARTLLDQVSTLEREIATMDDDLGGGVVLGGFPTTGIRLVPMVLARLRGEHPGIDLEFRAASTPVQLRKLRGGRLDLAIIAAGEGLPDYDLGGVQSEPLPGGPLQVALPTTHPLARNTVVEVADLARERWIVGRGAQGDPQFGAWPSLQDPTVAARVEGWSARLGFVAAGLGLTTIPSLAVAAVPSGVTTVRVEDPGSQRRELLLAWIGDLSPAMRAVRRAVRAEAAMLAATTDPDRS